MELAALFISIAGLLATLGVGCYFYNRTKSMTKEMQDFLITLIVNSAPNPQTLQRLLDDNMKTGSWRGTVERNPVTSDYHIVWKQNVGGGKI